MKKFVVISIIAALIITAGLIAAKNSKAAGQPTITLTWTNPNAGGIVAGSKVYMAMVAGGPYSLVADVPGNAYTYTTGGLAPGTYYFVATFYNSAGLESVYSAEAKGVVSTPPNAPSGVTATVNY